MAEKPETIPNPPNTIEDKAPKPKGVIPKNTQSMVIIGVAVLMILIMWLTGGKKVQTPSLTSTPPPPPVTPTDTTKVQAFKQAIQAEQQQALQSNPSRPSGPVASPSTAGSVPGVSNPYNPPPGQTALYPTPQSAGVAIPENAAASQQPAPLPDPIKAAEKRREYQSLFASNVALTYRKGQTAQKLTASPGGVPFNAGSHSPAQSAQAQALRDAEALAAMGPPAAWMPQSSPQPTSGSRPTSPSTPQPAHAQAKAVNPGVAQPGEFNSSTGKKHVLFEGTIIPTVLTNRLNGSYSGPVNCLVTHDVYSHDRQHVLIPAGTKVLGEARKVIAFGQQRLAVFFHRLIMPDGYSVSLDQFKGLDQAGATALHDKVNNHYVKIFGASLAVGILGGISEVGTAPVLTGSYLDQMRMGFGESMAMTGEQIMNRFLNLMPTITIREGTRVEVYLSNDLLLPDYNHHTMQSDL